MTTTRQESSHGRQSCYICLTLISFPPSPKHSTFSTVFRFWINTTSALNQGFVPCHHCLAPSTCCIATTSTVSPAHGFHMDHALCNAPPLLSPQAQKLPATHCHALRRPPDAAIPNLTRVRSTGLGQAFNTYKGGWSEGVIGTCYELRFRPMMKTDILTIKVVLHSLANTAHSSQAMLARFYFRPQINLLSNDKSLMSSPVEPLALVTSLRRLGGGRRCLVGMAAFIPSRLVASLVLLRVWAWLDPWLRFRDCVYPLVA
jgi:hypothetical protein